MVLSICTVDDIPRIHIVLLYLYKAAKKESEEPVRHMSVKNESPKI